MGADLELLMTDACSLCEQALDLLMSMPEVAGRRLVALDIVNDETLLAEFGETIPVLRLGERVLRWPFDRRDVVEIMARDGG